MVTAAPRRRQPGSAKKSRRGVIPPAAVGLDDLLVIGLGEDAARTSVDIHQKENASLAEGKQHKLMKSTFLEPSGIEGYFDFETFTEKRKADDVFCYNSSHETFCY